MWHGAGVFLVWSKCGRSLGLGKDEEKRGEVATGIIRLMWVLVC